MVPTRLELVSADPQSAILSIELWNLMWGSQPGDEPGCWVVIPLPTCTPERIRTSNHRFRKPRSVQLNDRGISVIPMRLERITGSLEGCCSIQLSYGIMSTGRRDSNPHWPCGVSSIYGYSFRKRTRLHPVVCWHGQSRTAYLHIISVAL